MVEAFTLRSNPLIVFGPGKLSTLPQHVARYGSRVLIVKGRGSLSRYSRWEVVERKLRADSADIQFVSIEGEPSPALIDKYASDMKPWQPDLVVALGGGSVLDAGKALSAIIPDEGSVMDYLEGVGRGKVHSGKRLPLIAIPSTSGTGSEATKNAVLTQTGPEGYKKSLRHDNFVPDIALVDPELTLSCPPELTASCGMDTFTQLLESYVSSGASLYTDSLAFEGLRCVRDFLLRVYDQPSDIQARSGMSYAALVSGITLANAGLGLVHGFASSVGGLFDIPHGTVCGTLMGAVTRQTIEKLVSEGDNKVALAKYAAVGRLFVEETGGDDKVYALQLAALIDEWVELLKMPRLATYGVTSGDVSRIAGITEMKSNPVALTQGQLEAILRSRL